MTYSYVITKFIQTLVTVLLEFQAHIGSIMDIVQAVDIFVIALCTFAVFIDVFIYDRITENVVFERKVASRIELLLARYLFFIMAFIRTNWNKEKVKGKAENRVPY